MTKVSQTEFDSLARRYNEQVSINASYQREIIELKNIDGSLERENDELKQIIREITNQLIKDGELIASLAISETANEYNNRNRIS